MDEPLTMIEVAGSPPKVTVAFDAALVTVREHGVPPSIKPVLGVQLITVGALEKETARTENALDWFANVVLNTVPGALR
jgi:hypothetical protein